MKPLRILALFSGFALAALPAFAVNYQYTITAKRNGVVLANATVRVTGAGGALSTIYSDSGGTPLANPTTTNSSGVVDFWAAAGSYRVVVGDTVFNITLPFVSAKLAANNGTCTGTDNQVVLYSSAGVASCGVGGGGGNSFETINAPSGTDPVAESSTDTLNVTCAGGLTCTGNSTTDTLDFTIGTLNQNTTGSAATLTTPRAIYGNNFDGSAALTQIIASTYGGTGNGFTKFSGPTTSEKTFTLPDASSTIIVGGLGSTADAIPVASGTGGVTLAQSSNLYGGTSQLCFGGKTSSDPSIEKLTGGGIAGVTLGAATCTNSGYVNFGAAFLYSPTADPTTANVRIGVDVLIDSTHSLRFNNGANVGSVADDTGISRHAAGVLSVDTTTRDDGLGQVIALGGLRGKSGNTASKPATCTVADEYLDTQVPAICFCTATDTWTCATLS